MTDERFWAILATLEGIAEKKAEQVKLTASLLAQYRDSEGRPYSQASLPAGHASALIAFAKHLTNTTGENE